MEISKLKIWALFGELSYWDTTGYVAWVESQEMMGGQVERHLNEGAP